MNPKYERQLKKGCIGNAGIKAFIERKDVWISIDSKTPVM